MNTQTEAQRLADALTRRVPVFEGMPIIDAAAAELRRLEAANAELLAALAAAGVALRIDHNSLVAIEKVSTAIAKHTP